MQTKQNQQQRMEARGRLSILSTSYAPVGLQNQKTYESFIQVSNVMAETCQSVHCCNVL